MIHPTLPHTPSHPLWDVALWNARETQLLHAAIAPYERRAVGCERGRVLEPAGNLWSQGQGSSHRHPRWCTRITGNTSCCMADKRRHRPRGNRWTQQSRGTRSVCRRISFVPSPQLPPSLQPASHRCDALRLQGSDDVGDALHTRGAPQLPPARMPEAATGIRTPGQYLPAICHRQGVIRACRDRRHPVVCRRQVPRTTDRRQEGEVSGDEGYCQDLGDGVT